MRDLDLNLVRLQLAWIKFVRQQLCTGRVHSETMYFKHSGSIPLAHDVSIPAHRLMLQHRWT
jgi:hypothetical protein